MADFKMERNGGRSFPVQVQLQYLPQTHQAGYEYRAVILDMSEQVHISSTLQFLDQCLEKTLEEQGRLVVHLLNAQEEERHRVALALHDQIGQDLNVLKLRLGEIKKNLNIDQGDLQQLCLKLEAFADHIIDDVRRIMRELIPSSLEVLGLVAGLRQMVREHSEFSSVRIETDLEPLIKVSKRETQIALFRIVQEALDNANRHADATQVTIRAFETKDRLRTLIEDNGKGFGHPGPDRSPGSLKGMGLAVMQVRARMIGARLTIESRSGKGTRILVDLPLGSA
ncbi:sensor histidine kinase [Desulfatitalea tepidiphila]|uniref:sensor histidine kinase n=1 Tax=Desulfatitalea tepidiphila TaxID=1185843 RepID=UPI0006B52606|nr:sensor histidine kinase [Desulfatitalea tepidiphila]